jgi:hypothetical protein
MFAEMPLDNRTVNKIHGWRRQNSTFPRPDLIFSRLLLGFRSGGLYRIRQTKTI